MEVPGFVMAESAKHVKSDSEPPREEVLEGPVSDGAQHNSVHSFNLGDTAGIGEIDDKELKFAKRAQGLELNKEEMQKVNADPTAMAATL